jgi:hypothetical protein
MPTTVSCLMRDRCSLAYAVTAQRLRFGAPPAVLDLLRRLPEEQVRADRRAEHGDDHRRVFLQRSRGRQECPGLDRFQERLSPRHADRQDDRDVGEHRERQPLEDAHRTLVREQHLRGDADGAEGEHVERLRPADDQLERFGHRADVGGDVDGVGDDQHRHQRDGQPARAHLVDVGREPVTRGPADARREHLDADHERRRQQQRPDEGEAELRAGLRVGGDAARVVVGGAGDEAGPEAARERLEAFLARLLRLGCGRRRGGGLRCALAAHARPRRRPARLLHPPAPCRPRGGGPDSAVRRR